MPTTTPRTEPARRLPLRPGERVGIVAGSGLLPIELARSLSAAGHRPVVVMVSGEADETSELAGYENDFISLEAIAELPLVLKRHDVTHAVLAGHIGRRPRLLGMRPSFALLRAIKNIVVALAHGDDGALKVLIRHIESGGIKVVGAHEIAPDLLAPAGPFGRHQPGKADAKDLAAALAGARAIGVLDIGQAAIAIGGRVIALEGIEGTDGLLERAVSLRTHGRIAGRTGGVLVKCAKPGQELRVDLPTIGPETVEAAHKAGLAGIGVEAGHSLVLDFGKVVQRADELGLFVFGLDGGKLE